MIESNSAFLSRTCMRNDLMSLGVLKGIALVTGTKHTLLGREVRRLMECENRDRVIQEPPKETLDRRSPIDLLFEWFDNSENSSEVLRKYQLLHMLAENPRMPSTKWECLMSSISKILEAKSVVMRRGRSDAKKETNSSLRRPYPDILNVSAEDTVSPRDCTQQISSASTSPAPSDPGEEKPNVIAASPKRNSLESDSLVLMTNAPLPKMKVRPR
ncbi:unnamed protein product [Cylicostephanus goldi]|uniref:Uncharacterized protein n=1 Tax=Cylicostephanus goldi TaxID=71465 RepID=A0A3P7MX85_CYLGO|nr:unnamed protein product [Cylicostephanus goldi]